MTSNKSTTGVGKLRADMRSRRRRLRQFNAPSALLHPVLPLGAGSDARDGFGGYRYGRVRCAQTGKAFSRTAKRLRSRTQ